MPHFQEPDIKTSESSKNIKSSLVSLLVFVTKFCKSGNKVNVVLRKHRGLFFSTSHTKIFLVESKAMCSRALLTESQCDCKHFAPTIFQNDEVMKYFLGPTGEHCPEGSMISSLSECEKVCQYHTIDSNALHKTSGSSQVHLVIAAMRASTGLRRVITAACLAIRQILGIPAFRLLQECNRFVVTNHHGLHTSCV